MFAVHTVERTFRFVCDVNGCQHTFKSGSSFSSFKTHASRKHPNWQELVNTDAAATIPSAPMPVLSLDSAEHPQVNENIVEDNLDPLPGADMPMICVPEVICSSLHFRPLAQNTAALFLLTFQEKYELSQSAINFALGSTHTIIDSVCESAAHSVSNLLETGASSSDIVASI